MRWALQFSEGHKGPPIAVSGERIGPAEMALFARYGVTEVEVLRQ